MRVLLTKLPPLLNGILSEALSGEPDMAVVGLKASGDIETLVGQVAADVVVMQGNREEAEELRRASRGALVVAIDADAMHAIVLGDAKPIVLSDVSPTTIIMAIRGMG